MMSVNITAILVLTFCKGLMKLVPIITYKKKMVASRQKQPSFFISNSIKKDLSPNLSKTLVM